MLETIDQIPLVFRKGLTEEQQKKFIKAFNLVWSKGSSMPRALREKKALKIAYAVAMNKESKSGKDGK